MKSLKPIKSLLAFLEPYQENLKHLGMGTMFSAEGIREEYACWVWLLKRLKHPLETGFFKQSWIPVDKENLLHFIDIDDKKLPIFCTHFHCIEPYQWYRINIIDNASELVDHIKDIDQSKLVNERYRLRKEQKFEELIRLYKESSL